MKPKLKTYEVLLKAYSVVVVSAINEDDAMELARENVREGDFEIESWSVDSQPDTPEAIDRVKRHANRVVEP